MSFHKGGGRAAGGARMVSNIRGDHVAWLLYSSDEQADFPRPLSHQLQSFHDDDAEEESPRMTRVSTEKENRMKL